MQSRRQNKEFNQVSNTYANVRRHPWRAGGLALFALMIAVSAFFVARHDTHANLAPTNFELDGNTHVTGLTPHDWSQVFDSTTYGANGADKALFIKDFKQQPNATDNQPTTGATKDPNDM